MPRDSISKNWRRVRHEARHKQIAAASERNESDDGGKVGGLAAALHGIKKELATSNDQNTPDKQRERCWKVWEVLGIWAAAIVGLIAVLWSAWDAAEQRGIMQGQLHEMQEASRITQTQLAAVLTIKWEATEISAGARHGWTITPHLFNKAATKAFDLRAYDDSSYQPNGTIMRLFPTSERAGARSFVLGGQSDTWLKSQFLSDQIMADLVAGKGQFLVWASVEYRDVFHPKQLHHIRACVMASPAIGDKAKILPQLLEQGGVCNDSGD